MLNLFKKLIIALIIAINPTQIENDFFLKDLGGNVVYVMDSWRESGGTGFVIRSPKDPNISYILTNAHVCLLSPRLIVLDEKRKVYKTKIIKVSKVTDLCLLKNTTEIKGLTLGKEVSKGQQLYVIGHPHLLPLTLSTGTLIEFDKRLFIRVENYYCDLQKGPFNYTDDGMCILHVKRVALTTVQILPGNSGSPVLNNKGEVIGIVFASNIGTMWGTIIPVESLTSFLIGM